MKTRSRITKLTETTTGGARTYEFNGRSMTRQAMVEIIKAGKVDGYHVLTVNDKDYIRSNPDGSSENNVVR